jgi:AraC-like DNA-binding protein
VKHIEFFHKEHFENNYFRVAPDASLSHYIDFFWETRFEELLQDYPQGFSDILFPNIGYTYLVNLGTPFIMQLNEDRFEIKKTGFLPRHTSIECYHRAGNQIFGIKFKISPALLEKKINFSEYRESISPLSYLVDEAVIKKIKGAKTFIERVNVATNYYQQIVQKSDVILYPVNVVREILETCSRENNFSTSIETIAAKYKISSRTLQRYFEATTSISSKKALQIMRVRKATAHLASSPRDFHYSLYGYYDHSHFYKHLKQFFQKKMLEKIKPHLALLEQLHKIP